MDGAGPHISYLEDLLKFPAEIRNRKNCMSRIRTQAFEDYKDSDLVLLGTEAVRIWRRLYDIRALLDRLLKIVGTSGYITHRLNHVQTVCNPFSEPASKGG
jgi:hypothetical protein